MRRPDSATNANMAPFLRQMQQSQRRGSTTPSGRDSSNTTVPQWHDARCFAKMGVGPIFLIMALTSITTYDRQDAALHKGRFKRALS